MNSVLEVEEQEVMKLKAGEARAVVAEQERQKHMHDAEPLRLIYPEELAAHCGVPRYLAKEFQEEHLWRCHEWEAAVAALQAFVAEERPGSPKPREAVLDPKQLAVRTGVPVEVAKQFQDRFKFKRSQQDKAIKELKLFARSN